MVTEELDTHEFDKVEKPGRSASVFEPEPETGKAESFVGSQDDNDDEAVMLELNHKSLRLLQA